MNVLKSVLCLGALYSLSSFAMLPTPTNVMQPLTPVATVAPALASTERTMTVDTTGQTVETVINAFIVTQNGNQELLTAVTQNGQVKPGDVVEYRGYFTNRSPDRIRKLTALLEIPEGVELLGGIEPLAPFATVDGVRFARTPLRTNTATGVQEIPLSYYKALRWDVEDIGLNGTAMVKYRARIK